MTIGMDAEFVTKSEAAEYLKVSTHTVDRMRAAGELPTYRLRRSVRFKASDVLALLVPESQQG